MEAEIEGKARLIASVGKGAMNKLTIINNDVTWVADNRNGIR